MPRDTPVTPCSPPFHSDGRCRAALRGRSRKAAVVTTARHRVSRPPENPGSEGHRAARNRPVLPPRHPAPDAVGGREAERALRSRPRQPAAGRPRTGTVRAQRTDGATARRGPARLPSDAAPPGADDCSAVRASPGTAARAPASGRHPAAGLDARLSARRRSLQRAHRLGQAPGTGRARDGAARPAGAEGEDEGAAAGAAYAPLHGRHVLGERAARRGAGLGPQGDRGRAGPAYRRSSPSAAAAPLASS